jgi:PucR family transcriptional regulator, purine catabolism regulatory protein
MPDTQPILLEELTRLALPTGATVLAGRGSMLRPVTWVVSTTASDCAARLSSGDFAFLLPPYLTELIAQIPRLAQIGVAGLAVIGDVLPTIVDAAERSELPLLALPELTNLRRIERMALALVLDRDTAIEQRAAQLYQQLTIMSAEAAGLDAMATLIGRATGKTVLIQDKRLELIAAWYAPEPTTPHEAIKAWVGASANLPKELWDRKRAAQSQDILEQPLPMDGLTRLIVPIIAKGMARGFLSLIAPSGSLGNFDRNVGERGAAACALEMAKAKAVSEAEKRVRGNFVDALLAASLSSLEAARWAKHNKYNPDGRHAAIVADWSKKEHPSYRRLETLIHGLVGTLHSGVLTQARENEVVIFSQLDPRQGIESARHLADSIRRQAANEFPDDPLALGIGRPVDALVALRDSYREARQALSMARRLADPNPLYFGELNVYRLLFQLEYSPELASFCQETIGTLVEYDRSQGTDLIETLTSYFAHKGNLSQTAEALFVHRNTLLYRMERIKEISGLDLDNPETRLSIQLALRAHRLLTAREE